MATKRKSAAKAMRLPLMPLRGLMIFPHMVLHFDVGRPRSVAALEAAMLENQRIFLVAQKDAEIENPTVDEILAAEKAAGDIIAGLMDKQRRITGESL